MTESFYVDPNGIADGLPLWWSNDTNVTILNHGNHFIDTKLSIKGEVDWFMIFIYGTPYVEDKQAFWESLSSLRSNKSEKWCIIGDSNVVARPEEKSGGGVPFDSSQAKWF
ncbi:hypothetical protein V6N12_012903 [Hibiscus sabdariffa]|uniref:Uncharacterized protein n=1 Tax=Hibiscus sabdariffa TaxID=183260 RepID=A0ABR2EHD4_9ROSI